MFQLLTGLPSSTPRRRQPMVPRGRKGEGGTPRPRPFPPQWQDVNKRSACEEGARGKRHSPSPACSSTWHWRRRRCSLGGSAGRPTSGATTWVQAGAPSQHPAPSRVADGMRRAGQGGGGGGSTSPAPGHPRCGGAGRRCGSPPPPGSSFDALPERAAQAAALQKLPATLPAGRGECEQVPSYEPPSGGEAPLGYRRGSPWPAEATGTGRRGRSMPGNLSAWGRVPAPSPLALLASTGMGKLAHWHF